MNREPPVSRETSIATRAGPLSMTRIRAGPETNALGAACSCAQSMFQAGHCAGLSYEMAKRAGAESSSLPIALSKMLATSPSWFSRTR